MCTFDKDKGPRRLMKKGLTLILVGHINFILGAIVHGNVLRHISKPSQHITTEYTVANIISVTSGLLSIAAGIIAIVVSRNLHVLKLQIGLLIASFLNALLSAACCTGLLLAISVTVAHNGEGLMLGCNDTMVPTNARSPVSARCPFDTTRIYLRLDCLSGASSLDWLSEDWHPVGIATSKSSWRKKLSAVPAVDA
ncbi:keratinocyte-associated protein 3 isoform X3 [Perca fluviatilis]|uniref:keratinocyte-associated protein 3 isoform X3 n=1 Tax=Perca fluviatilis TaxID=8168 RepID=UPI0019648C11|nr:keratinocyte-associated protein 3 isoform X3 [Perca fluviatilis]